MYLFVSNGCPAGRPPPGTGSFLTQTAADCVRYQICAPIPAALTLCLFALVQNGRVEQQASWLACWRLKASNNTDKQPADIWPANRADRSGSRLKSTMQMLALVQTNQTQLQQLQQPQQQPQLKQNAALGSALLASICTAISRRHHQDVWLVVGWCHAVDEQTPTQRAGCC